MLLGSDKVHRGAARLCRSAMERVQAITNLGLSADGSGSVRPVRDIMPGRAGRPDVSYLAAGRPGDQRILFVHGTPGEAADWLPFLKATPPGQHRIAADRPGFGGSGPGRAVIALADQAEALAGLIAGGEAPAVVVGSSYGGPVALRLAADHPHAVAGVILVGAAGDPSHERPHPVQRLVGRQALARLLPRALAHSNAELLALREELCTLAQNLDRVSAPVTILQGLRDTLVPPGNAHYIRERLVTAARRRLVLVGDAGHFLHILRPALVEEALHELIGKVRAC